MMLRTLTSMMRTLIYTAGLVSLCLFATRYFPSAINAAIDTDLSIDIFSGEAQIIDIELTKTMSFWAFALATTPLISFLICLFHFDRLAASYQAGEFFTLATNRRFTWISILLIVIALTSLFDQLLMHSLLSGQLEQTLEVSGSAWVLVSLDLPIVILGVIFFFMSRVMDEALRMKLDLDLTV